MSEGLDLWEFVHCSICFRLWSDGPTVPFWATGCGHIVCNDHLNGDRSCATCGAHDVEVLLLKNDLSEPISHWFRPLSHSQHSAILASRFQVDMLASLLRHYRRESQRQRHIISKLRRFVHSNGDLREDAAYMHEGNSENMVPIPVHPPKSVTNRPDYEYTMNSNGKRQLAGILPASSTMSFRSVPTPAPPARLTLPNNRPPPTIGNLHPSTPAQFGAQHDDGEPTHPSGSNLRRFAYHSQQPTDAAPRNQDYGVNMSARASTYSKQRDGFSPSSHVRVLHRQSLPHSAPPPQHANQLKPFHTPTTKARVTDSQGRIHPSGAPIAPAHSAPHITTPRHPEHNPEYLAHQHITLLPSRDHMKGQNFSVNPVHHETPPSVYAADHQPQVMHPLPLPDVSAVRTNRIFASTPSIRPHTAQSSHSRLPQVANINQSRFRPVSATRTPARSHMTGI